MIAVAEAEQERKAERQKLAFEQAAINGKRFTGCPGRWLQDRRVARPPGRRPRVAEVCDRRCWAAGRSRDPAGVDRLGLTPPQHAKRGTSVWNRTSIRSRARTSC